MNVPIELPPGLDGRPATRGDLADVYTLVAAYEQRVIGETMVELDELEGDWDRPSFVPERHSLLVHDQDALVGWGEVYGARRATGFVHPDAWGHGIGGALVDWIVAVAHAEGGRRVGQTVPDGDTAAAELLRARGWSPLWTSWVLELPPGERVPPRALPGGYVLRDFRPGQDERATYRVIEDAFNEWPDRDPTEYRDWAAPVLGRPGFEPWQILLVGHGDEVVGACHLVVSGETGWINQVAVAREHRGRGIAQALMAAAFDAARTRGAVRGELSTDSRTGALGLYERIGMRVKSSFTHWAVDLLGAGPA